MSRGGWYRYSGTGWGVPVQWYSGCYGVWYSGTVGVTVYGTVVQWYSAVQYSGTGTVAPVPVTQYRYTTTVPLTRCHHPLPQHHHPVPLTRYTTAWRYTPRCHGLGDTPRMTVLPKGVPKRAKENSHQCIFGHPLHAWLNRCSVGFCHYWAKALL